MRTSLILKQMTWAFCAILMLSIAQLQGQDEMEEVGIASGNVQSVNKVYDATPAFLEGLNISPEEAAELEDVVAKDPNDLESQSRLLSYYYVNASKDRTLHKKREQTVLWLIRHHPEAAALSQMHGHLLPPMYNYAEGEKLWKEQLQNYPGNIQVISNACGYFDSGNYDLAVECYKLGKSLDPENPAEWDRKLGQIYNIIMANSPAEEKSFWAKEALSAYENAYAESRPRTFSYDAGGSTRTVTFPDLAKGSILRSLAKVAFTAGELEKATGYANQMLEAAGENSFHKGDYIYDGNSILGLVAMHNGDLEAAEWHLLQAGETPGSAGLKSFGPDMGLAKELMDYGRTDTVLAFLKKCQKFWTSDTLNPLSQWIQEMEEGRTPDFNQVRHELQKRIEDELQALDTQY